MSRQEKSLDKKIRGRPPIGRGVQVNVMFRPETASALDAWAIERKLSRIDAVRSIVTDYLKRRGFIGKGE